MGFCKFTKSGRPASVSGDRKSLSLRGAKRRGNPFFSCKEADSHASDAVTGVGMTGSGTSRTPSPTTVHRTHPQGDDAHTSPRRTNAHFAAGHMGPALQGTPVMQDGTAGRRPLQRFIVPVRRGRCPHIAPPAAQRGRRKRLPACRKSPDGLFRQAGRQNRKIKTTFYFAILVAAAGDWTRKGTLTVPFHTILPSDICDRTGSLTG